MKSILLIADVPGWIFHRHCLEIKKRITEHHFDIKFTWQEDPSRYVYTAYDIVYQLDPMGVPGLNPPREKTIIGLRNEFMYDHSKAGLIGFYKSFFEPRCLMFHVVNKNQYREFSSIPLSIPLLLVQHGVDIECFKPKNKRDVLKNNEIIVGISGNPTSSGNKGFDLVEQSCKITGCQLLTSKQNLGGTHNTKEQMAEYYNKIDIYCCMSLSEGLNNCIMEAGATAVPIITTKNGAVEEMVRNGEDGYIIERTVNSLVEKLTFFKNNRQSIAKFGSSFMENIRTNWSWDIRIKDFRRMFDKFSKVKSS